MSPGLPFVRSKASLRLAKDLTNRRSGGAQLHPSGVGGTSDKSLGELIKMICLGCKDDVGIKICLNSCELLKAFFQREHFIVFSLRSCRIAKESNLIFRL